jgi:hypothetical protein
MFKIQGRGKFHVVCRMVGFQISGSQ